VNSLHNDHERQVEALSAYLDDALPSAEHEALERHLATCAECRAELEELRHVRALLRALPAPVPPRSFTLPATTASATRAAPSWTRVAQWGGGLVAVVGVGLLAAGALNTHPTLSAGAASRASYNSSAAHSSVVPAGSNGATTTPTYGLDTPGASVTPSGTYGSAQATGSPQLSVTPSPTASSPTASAETGEQQQSASSPLAPVGATLLVGGGAALTAGSLARRRKRKVR
jgi:anti-sigma factor RsiW